MGFRVFVTQEVYPFTAGGIGRVIGNFLADSTPVELAQTALVVVSNDKALQQKLVAVYPGVTCIVVSESDYEQESVDGRRYPPVSAFSATHALHSRSTLVMQALLRLERHVGGLDYVEFPDWGGFAFASCQEKKLGRGFSNTILAVRLHTTDSILMSMEQRGVDLASLALYDLERKAIADCDMIVGQLRPVAEHVRKFYGFHVDEWQPRLRIHAPTVKLDGMGQAGAGFRPQLDTPITFTSKVQHCKRPDIFVRGCVEFLQNRPDVTAQVLFVAHAFDGDYFEQIKSLIPAALAGRFQFLSGLAGAHREELISRSVCVFPTVYESFCLAAYEASMAGALAVVNTGNPAFGPDTPWLPGSNCIGFDGTAQSLATALQAAYSDDVQIVPVRVPEDKAPWIDAIRSRPLPMGERPKVSAVVVHRQGAGALIDTLDSLSASTIPLEVVVAASASEDPVSSSLLDRLQEAGDGRIIVERFATKVEVGAIANRAIGLASGDYILMLQSGDLPGPTFAEEAAGALARHANYSIVTAHALLKDGFNSSHHGSSRFIVNTGEARILGLYRNHFSSSCCMVRSADVRRLRFSEEMGIDPWWDFHFRATASGLKYVVSSSADVTSGVLPDADPVTPVARGLRHELLRSKSAAVMGMTLPLYMLEGLHAEKVRSEADPSVGELIQELDSYRNSEAVFMALTVTRFLDARAPSVLRMVKSAMRGGWRTYKAIRGR